MAAGFFEKALATLLSSRARWVEFADGTAAPAHGAILIDPTTGLPAPCGSAASPTHAEIRSPAPAASIAATIASGQSLSGAVDLVAERAHRIDLPDAWTAAPITFRASPDGAAWYDLYTELGEYSLSTSVVGASRALVLDQAIFYGIRHLKIRSGTSASPVNQAAARAVGVVSVPA